MPPPCDEIPSRKNALREDDFGAAAGNEKTQTTSGVMQRAGSRWTFSRWKKLTVEGRNSSESFELVTREAGGIQLRARYVGPATGIRRPSASHRRSATGRSRCFEGAGGNAEDTNGLPWRRTAALESEGFRGAKPGSGSQSGGAGETRAKLAGISALEGVSVE